MTDTPNVTRQLVAEEQRLHITEQLFGLHFPLRLEPVIYNITGRLAKDYHGGYWDFYTLSNGGFYMAPDAEELFPVACDNQWQGQLTGDALGITACLYAYSHLSMSNVVGLALICARHYHLLREYMLEHTEVVAILSAID